MGVCNTCYKRRRGSGQPEWLANCQRCGRRFAEVIHRSWGLCRGCYDSASGAAGGQLDYWISQFEINRPDSTDRLLSEENRLALKLARMIGATGAARLLSVSVETFRLWAANREIVPVRHRTAIRQAYTSEWKRARNVG